MQQDQISPVISEDQEFSAPSAKETLPPSYEPSPDNPPWNVPLAFITFILSIFLLVFFGSVPVMIYGAMLDIPSEQLLDFAMQPNQVFIGLLGTIPAHILTLLLCWKVVTRNGDFPASKTLGFSWGGFNLGYCILVVILFYVVFGTMIYYFGAPETEMDKIIQSSRAAVYTVAFLAIFTAPLVEELVYRGVLYSALQRSVGVASAILLTTAVFALIHVPQYKTSLIAIMTILVLSLGLTIVRWKSKNLWPCIVIHLIFNGIQAVILVLHTALELESPVPVPENVTGLVRLLM